MTVVAVTMVMTVFMVTAVIAPISVTTIVGIKRKKEMNKPKYPYWRRRYYDYGYPYHMPYYGGTSLINSQYSNVAQNLYNTGFMAGVTQSSVVNQFQNRDWW